MILTSDWLAWFEQECELLRRLRERQLVHVDHYPRCWHCGRVLGEYFGRPWSLRCRRCHQHNWRD